MLASSVLGVMEFRPPQNSTQSASRSWRGVGGIARSAWCNGSFWCPACLEADLSLLFIIVYVVGAVGATVGVLGERVSRRDWLFGDRVLVARGRKLELMSNLG